MIIMSRMHFLNEKCAITAYKTRILLCFDCCDILVMSLNVRVLSKLDR